MCVGVCVFKEQGDGLGTLRGGSHAAVKTLAHTLQGSTVTLVLLSGTSKKKMQDEKNIDLSCPNEQVK